jgi:hypothetical protein
MPGLMRSSSTRLLSAMVLVVLLASQALAADKDEARRLFQSGLKSMQINDFSAAADDLERSFALNPIPESLLNLAACYRSMQRYGAALDALKRLRQEFADKLKPDLKSACDKLEGEVQSLVATLVLSVEPPSAEVSIDGRATLASSGTESYLLSPGDHTVEASLAGYRTLTRSVHLAAGTQTSERLVLEPAPGILIVRSDPSGATVVVDGQARATTPTQPALELSPGKHLIALRMNGRIPAERNLDIRSGEQQVMELTLPSLAVLPLPLTIANDPAQAAPGKAKPPTRFARILGQLSAVGAVLAGGAAIVLWQGVAEKHFQKMKEYDNRYVLEGNPDDDRNRRAALHNAQTVGYAAMGCGVGAGVLAATALAAFIIDAGDDGAKQASRISLTAAGIRLGF